MTESGGSNHTSGWLSKWTNIIGGYQKRWFVLSDGMLCYYKNRDEMAHTCRGTICLSGATIDSDETCKFVISRNGYAYHVKADSQEDKQRWIEALTAARDAASTDDRDSQMPFTAGRDSDTTQAVTLMSTMKQKLNDIKACVDLINNHGTALQHSITEMENSSNDDDRLRDVSDMAVVFQATASSLVNACTDYFDLAESHSRQWVTLFQSEQEQRVRLEQIVKSLTEVHSQTLSRTLSDEGNLEYFDCSDEFNTSEIEFPTMQVYQAVDDSGPSVKRKRRTRIPDRPNVSANLWAILKNCIGKDLTKMPLPVAFAEPLSMLQRLTEDFEYAHVLDKASQCPDVQQQFVYIAAFVASSYSTTIGRTGKPFNSLLGETYECDRTSDLGWKSIAEQVSHHPPMAALFCEGRAWQMWMDESMQTKFRGATLHIIPQGECHLQFTDGNRYSWRKPTTNIHNIIIGKLWVEQEGDVEIRCFTSDVKCHLTFSSAGWFGETWSVKGVIKNGTGKPVFEITGKYSTQIEYKPAGTKTSGTVVWKRTDPPKDSAKYYNFTVLSCQLNEMEPGVAPTDSRNRPDQRLMEEGKFDDANAMKKNLEDWQRANKKDTWTPAWFKRRRDHDTNTEMWTYGGEYWSCKTKKDWSRCPTYIFNPG